MLQEIVRFFTFHKLTLSTEEENLYLGRLYAFIGTALTPIMTVLTFSYHSATNLVWIGIIVLSFAFVLYGSYHILSIKNNIHKYLLWVYTLILFYCIAHAYINQFSSNESIATLVAYALFTIVSNNIKHQLWLTGFTLTVLTFALNYIDETIIDKYYYLTFFFMIAGLNFAVLRSRSLIQQKLNNRDHFLKTLFNETEDGFLIISFYSKEIIDCNKKVLQLFEVAEKSQIIGHKKDKFQKFKDRQADNVEFNNKLSQGGHIHKNIVFVSAKGKEFIADVVFSSINIGDNLFYVARITDISEELYTEKKVLESEKRYRQLFNRNVAGVFKIALNGNIVDINNAFSSMFGYSKKELLDGNINSIFLTTEDQQNFLKELKESNILHNKQIYLKKKDGSKLYVLINVAIRKDENEEFIEGTLLDITEIKQTEDRLIESEKRFKLLSNVAIEGIVLSENEVIIDANRQFVKIHGYNSIDEVLGKNFKEFVAEEDYPKVRNYIDSGSKEFYTVKSTKKDGSHIIVETRGENIPFGNKIIRASVVLDVTEREERHRKLQESEERFKRIAEAAFEGIAIVNKQGEILDVNNKFCELFALERTKLVGDKSVFDLVENTIHKQLQELLVKGLESTLESTVTNKHKATLQIEIKGKSINMDNQDAFVIAIRDITQRKQLEKEQIRAELAEESNKNLQSEIKERKKVENELQNTKKFIESIIDSSLDMIISTDSKRRITTFNKAAEKIFRFDAEEVLGKDIFTLYQDKNEALKVNEELQNKGEYFGEIININKEGKPFISYIAASNLKNEKGEQIGSMGVSRDITEIKLKEEQIQRSERNYRTLFDQAYIGIARVSLDGKFQQVNNQLCEIFGFSEEELLQTSVDDITHNDDINVTEEARIHLLEGKGEQISLKKRFIHDSGKEIVSTVTTSLVKDLDGKPEYMVMVVNDITEREEAQQQIQRQAAKIESIFQSSDVVMIWTLDRNLTITSANETLLSQFEWATHVPLKVGDNYMETIEPFLIPKYAEPFKQFFIKTFDGTPQHFEGAMYNYSKNEADKIWLETFLTPIHVGDNKIEEISCMAMIITEKKLQEKELIQSLNEKEILLKEVHHRVKNNLQVISSILNLQSSYVKDEATLNILTESQNRVKSMAFIHESLYQTRDFSQINFSDYIKNLSTNLLHSYQIYDNLVDLNIDVQELKLDLDQSIPAGLIVNELVSNALKYAFPNEREGTITITLNEMDGNIMLGVKDNGVGMPKDINFEESETLGLQLVSTLTEQLSGELIFSTDKNIGSSFIIKFKREESRKLK